MEFSGPGPVPPPLPCVPPPLPPPQPWNGWWTLLWAVAVMGVVVVAQVLLLFAGLIVLIPQLGGTAGKGMEHFFSAVEKLSTDGDFLGISLLVSGGVACAACFLLGQWRRGFTGAGYLGLGPLPRGAMLFWLGLTLLLVLGEAFLAPQAGAEEVPEFMREIVKSTDAPWLLFLSVVIGAPLWEEILFRGLLFRGWQASRLGLHGTVFLTSVTWTLLHALQYGPVQLAWLFLIGLLLGYARHRTGSLWVPIAMHALNNLVATIAIYWIMAGEL